MTHVLFQNTSLSFFRQSLANNANVVSIAAKIKPKLDENKFKQILLFAQN
jgi:hypothetical protein